MLQLYQESSGATRIFGAGKGSWEKT